MNKADEIKKKNRVYTATGDEYYGCTYIAAKSVKEAKKIALTTWIAEIMENYIDLSIRWIRGVETNYEGELNIKQINELGLTWWSCPKCDKEDFEILDDYTYKCKNCGNEFKIPYVNS